MESFIKKYQSAVVQIGTPHSIGTGFLLPEHGIVVTNEHVVRDSREVTLDGTVFRRCIAKVVYWDALHDVAFIAAPPLESDVPQLPLSQSDRLEQGQTVVALGHPFGYAYSATRGIVSNPSYEKDGLSYIQHDAALNPGNSGGPLIDEKGELVAVNNFVMKDGNSMGFSLPIRYIRQALALFDAREGTATASRCSSCTNIVFEGQVSDGYCGHCGSSVALPSEAPEYEPTGIALTIERFIGLLGHDVRLCRMGHDHWVVREGSAQVKLFYNEREGMIFGDAYLCQLPPKNIAPIYAFLLKENNKLENLSLSIPANGRDIVLSLFIYDRYLDERTGRDMFFNLFKKADYYDNVLIEEYGAVPNKGWVDV